MIIADVVTTTTLQRVVPDERDRQRLRHPRSRRRHRHRARLARRPDHDRAASGSRSRRRSPEACCWSSRWSRLPKARSIDRLAAARVRRARPDRWRLLDRLGIFDGASPATARGPGRRLTEEAVQAGRHVVIRRRRRARRPVRDRVGTSRCATVTGPPSRRWRRSRRGRLLRRDRTARAATSHRLRHRGHRLAAVPHPGRGLLAHRRTRALASRRRC